ncbi:MAG: FecR domain-containing protein [Salinivirgaceae bacterium]|nr:FecR domain-containing protein [Salinivirgaceae bacterium]
MKKEENILYDNIIDYLSGIASEDEKIHFEKCLSESSDNAELFQKVKCFWDDTTTAQIGDVNNAWSSIKNAIKERKRGLVRRHLFQISVAATLLLLIASGWFIKNSAIEMVSFVTNEDTFRKDTLKDGSIVYLYPSSKLEMKNNKSLAYNKEMNLEGEAFFVVPSSPDKEIIINVGDVAIKVKGTSFRVSTNKNGEISVAVESGSVELSTNKTGKKKLLVEAGEEGYYSSRCEQIWKQSKKENIYLIYQATNIN